MFLEDALQHFRRTSDDANALSAVLASYAAEWMLDNAHILRQTFRLIEEDMPPGFLSKLPKLTDGPLQGWPRIFAIAQELINNHRLHLDQGAFAQIRRFVELYDLHSAAPLRMAELWALPVMLRIGILECLAQTLSRILDGANRARNISATPSNQPAPRQIIPGFTLTDPKSADKNDEQRVGSCFISLRTLATQDWREFFESVSRVERAMCAEKSGVYPRMDKETRDLYRKEIERLSEGTRLSEIEVTRKLLTLAGDSHVGYYLIDQGRSAFEKALNYRPSVAVRLRRFCLRFPTLVYIGSVVTLWAFILAVLFGYLVQHQASAVHIIAVAIMSLVLVSTVTISLVDWVITLLLPPRVLPKMDFSEGIPLTYRSMIVIPALLTDAAEVNDLISQLERHYLRNADKHLHFALLSDFADAPQQHMPTDEPLIERARAGILALNKKYNHPNNDLFYLFHRERQWNAQEGVWMGWERKRGKLHHFNQRLRQNETRATTNEAPLFPVEVGDSRLYKHIRFVITLDADTTLQPNDANRLIGTAAHPLNRPRFDARTGRVTAGYTVFQPRAEITAVSANQSRFARIFAGDTGLDLYTHAVSNVYQDLFGAGIYVGKGLYDVDAFERSLTGRVPPNALLSHDLFEGIHGRVGLVSDVVVFEDYPPNYLVFVRRSRRWIRGDWQLLPWLLLKVPSAKQGYIKNNLPIIDRWKLLDNLRRSLLSPFLLLWFVAAWLWLPGTPLLWTLLGVLVPAVPLLTGLLMAAKRAVKEREVGASLQPLRHAAWRWLLLLIFIPYETIIVVSSIIVTLVRVFITRRNLLRWTTAAQVVRAFGESLSPNNVWVMMLPAVAVTGFIFVLTAGLSPTHMFTALPLLLAWMFSPQIAYSISVPTKHVQAALTEAQHTLLRRISLLTWMFFERFVGPDDHWLPPDNYQEAPRGSVTSHTSPTNIGLMLLSTLAAHDFGYINLQTLLTRLELAFNSISKLDRYRGHLLNWYDTRTLQTLTPRYVSTVDSGNLAACLIALRHGLQELQQAATLSPQQWQGLIDTLAIFEEAVNAAVKTNESSDLETTNGVVSDPADAADNKPLRGQNPKRVHAEANTADLSKATQPILVLIQALRQQVSSVQANPDTWAALLQSLAQTHKPALDRGLIALIDAQAATLNGDAVRRIRETYDRVQRHILNLQRSADHFLPWLPALQQLPAQLGEDNAQRLKALLRPDLPLGEINTAVEEALVILAQVQTESPLQEMRDWASTLSQQLHQSLDHTQATLSQINEIDTHAERIYNDMDFGFLFDKQRKLFYIGYNLNEDRPDSNYYDLLASEARLASLVAIAKREVPVSHWLHLGRSVTEINGQRTLLSWSATMFEYLMPILLTRSYPGTLLTASCESAVYRQIQYAEQQDVPWGISESGYFAFDGALNYQYRAFGVPGLGFKRDLDEDLVITPYASALALPIEPAAVADNFARLINLDMLGHYGLYESMDFTIKRMTLGNKQAAVREYMAHHQGMILLSLNNYLNAQPMIRRFHADPHIQSIELLLQERIPTDAPIESVVTTEVVDNATPPPALVTSPWPAPARAAVPFVHALSNGRITTLLTGAGGGYSQWRDYDLTRWRADSTLDNWGTWLYLRDLDKPEVGLWSPTAQSLRSASANADTQFYAHQAVYRSLNNDIAATLEITIAPDDDVEIRRLVLINHSDTPRRIRITSYGEVIMTPQANDARHPAFNKLFIEGEYVASANALLFRRRPRSQRETQQTVFVAHMAVLSSGEGQPIAYDTDRARFWADETSPLKRTGAYTPGPADELDPIFSITQEVEIAPRAGAHLAFLTIAADTRQAALTLARRYRAWHLIDRAFEQARARAELELHQLKLGTPQLEQYQQLLSVMLFPHRALRADATILANNRKGQPGLWAYGVSGDYPIVLIYIREDEDLALVQELLQAHTYWRNRHIQIDLVIELQKAGGYSQEMREKVHRLLVRAHSDAWLNRRGGIFIVALEQMAQEDANLLAAVAGAVLDPDHGNLAEQLRALQPMPTQLPILPLSRNPADPEETTPELARPTDLQFDNGYGGFSSDGNEYVIYLKPGQHTPAPWTNVIANAEFGFLSSSTGGGYTWALNSGENRLTPWSNDAVDDIPGEVLYLRDEETARVWSPLPSPCPAPNATHLIRHGAGYSSFEHHSNGLKQHVELFVAPDAPVKVIRLRLENTWSRPRRLTATFYVEWVLGVHRGMTQPHIVTEFDDERQALLARNAYNTEFGERVAFLAAGKRLHGLTADRTEFLGRLGSLAQPDALKRIGLSGTVGPGLDACGALQLHFDLQPGQSEETYFILGEGETRALALQHITRFQDAANVALAWEGTQTFWKELLAQVQVQTPDRAVNLLLNRWLPYQTLACRIWGRSAFYQSSGAYGFRDQLQDVMAFLHSWPQLAREQIIRAAQYQFDAGDVLHWWHPPSGRGVRTHCSDDLLWLPYVTAQYINVTGDMAILDEPVPVLTGTPLRKDEEDRYGLYAVGTPLTLLEHCLRAIERGSTAGPHGLPLIGSGDWNDGMSRVGVGGKGESVWLAWFLHNTLTRFADVCIRVGKADVAERFHKRAEALAHAVETQAWDGAWYRRAYYDDGTPLGSSQNDECQIDAIAQSWSVLSGAGDRIRANTAMRSALSKLVRPDDRVIMLLTPPFDKTAHDPGYIKGYVPGIRENGGQYTHAAIWTTWACAALGLVDETAQLFNLLNPIKQADNVEKVERYKVEPYVIAADIYAAAPRVGRGGWTWYTGSAGWMYRLGLEGILGLRRSADHLEFNPCIPKEWDKVCLRYRVGEALYHVHIVNESGKGHGVREVQVNGQRVEDGRVPLQREGEHEVSVVL